MRGWDDYKVVMTFIAIRKTTSNAQKIKSITVSMPSYQLRLHDPAYFCENLYLYIFCLLSFAWVDGDLSS